MEVLKNRETNNEAGILIYLTSFGNVGNVQSLSLAGMCSVFLFAFLFSFWRI